MSAFKLSKYNYPANCYWGRPRGPGDVTVLILHHTGGTSTPLGVHKYLASQGYGVHHVVGKDGARMAGVNESFACAHAGESAWRGRPSCNGFSIGVEIINLGNGRDPYPDAQVRSVAELAHGVMRRHPKITRANITDHKAVCRGANVKIDMSANWPWAKFWKYLDEYDKRPLTAAERKRLRKRLARATNGSLRWLARLVRRLLK